MLVHEFLERSARRFPEKEALIFEGWRLTYAQLDACANQLAHALRAAGVARGDRVMIFAENRVETAIAIFGALKAGGVFVVVNPTTKASKLAYLLRNCRPAALVTQRARAGVALAACAEGGASLRVTIWADLALGTPAPAVTGPGGTSIPSLRWDEALAAQPATKPAVPCIDIDLATIIYTSGSTGNPKGVVSTHANVRAAATSITTYLENTPDDVVLSVLPLSFDYGLYQLLMVCLFGGTLVLERGFTFPARALKLLHDARVTGFPVVPTIASILLQMETLRGEDYPDLRYITNTAAALPVSHIQRLREKFPAVRLFSMYGLTECKRVSYLPPEELDRRPGSVGIAIPNTEVYVVDDEGKRVPPETIGELVVRGAHVMRGYWEAPEETAKRYRPGPLPGETVLYTGDLFKMDADGFLYFIGRKDDIIKSRGEKVAPKEIEAALYQLDGVQEAAAVGVPDPMLGEAIKIFVALVPDAPLSEREIRAHCAHILEDFMQPKYVEIWTGPLPKGNTGKIDKKALI
ncbi:MAG TPA: AMP-binding protein [Ktedonobacterales bacterium]|nr:AMP-binding protein [Ktedonobacterales bacterium]